MSKPKIIPAFLNALTYNERKYLSHFVFAGLAMAVFLTYGVFVIIPESFTKFNVSNSHLFIYFFFFSLFIIEVIKYRKYKKLIKLEPKVKQTKEGSKA